MGLNAGEFDQRIYVFQMKQVEKNSIGEENVVWVDVVTSTPDPTIWAKVIPLRGGAFFAANQQQHTVGIRFRVDVRERSGLSNLVACSGRRALRHHKHHSGYSAIQNIECGVKQG